MRTRFQRVGLAVVIILASIALSIIGVVVLTVVVYEAADDPNPRTTDEETRQATQQLLDRPSLEEAERQARTIMEQIGTVAGELVPGIRLGPNRDREVASCPRPFDQTEGRTVRLQNLYSDTRIPDDVWHVYVERVRALAATLGAIQQRQATEEPSTGAGRGVNFYNPDTGTTIWIGSDRVTIISGTVGCHLPQDKFGSPIPATR
ncbi:LppA family lipoprotein [Nocardia asiatica]|uniref:LppA family lipoprotein n=1 Tax=Nocardia asiatica TaxID=209252 RepID=UPI0024583530|nr:LppA family lipoprotein [Nocardia asiatica]